MSAEARILVIDDSPTIRRVVNRALSDEGYLVSLASGGQDGVDETRGLRPDLLLLDFVMPGMNGYQVVKALADDPTIEDVPILLMCTRNDQVPDDALDGLGVVGTVIKPFSPQDLVQKVGEVLSAHGTKEREETAPIMGLASALTAAGFTAEDPAGQDFDFIATDPGTSLPDPADLKSGLDEDLAAAAALADLSRVLADALYARGIDDADTLSDAICSQVRSGLQGALLKEFVRRELGTDVLNRPIPALYGDLAAVPLPEVLQLMKFQGQTGLLEVSLDRGRYEVSFRRGHIVAIRARNTRAGMRLGQYFVEMKVLTEDELEEVANRKGDQRPLGQRLLQEGRIDEGQLHEALGRQANDLMFDLLRAREGVFGLRPGDEHLPDSGDAPGFSVDELLFESLRRVDEATVFRKEVPSMESAFMQSSDATEDGLTAEEIAVFRLLPRGGETITAGALMRAVTATEHQIEKVLYRLVVLGRATRSKEKEDDA